MVVKSGTLSTSKALGNSAVTFRVLKEDGSVSVRKFNVMCVGLREGAGPVHTK